ncbi:MAG TPA: hypothetical protein VGO76_19070 [Luteibacter sp.]|nr:hypothetical protein [Luteibacter sp.]
MKAVILAAAILVLGGCAAHQAVPPNGLNDGHLAVDPSADPKNAFCHSGPNGQTAACIGAAIETKVANEALR